MANSPQAIKRVRQNNKKRLLRQGQRRMIKTLQKNVLTLIAKKANKEAQSAYQLLVSCIDRYATRGVIKKNKAANVKSRMNKKLKMSAAS